MIGTNSWLEDNLERKRKRKYESTSMKDTISLKVHFGSTLTKFKKQKTLSILGKDLEIGHLTMEIAKPNKGGRIEDMTLIISLCIQSILEKLDMTQKLSFGG